MKIVKMKITFAILLFVIVKAGQHQVGVEEDIDEACAEQSWLSTIICYMTREHPVFRVLIRVLQLLCFRHLSKGGDKITSKKQA